MCSSILFIADSCLKETQLRGPWRTGEGYRRALKLQDWTMTDELVEVDIAGQLTSRPARVVVSIVITVNNLRAHALHHCMV